MAGVVQFLAELIAGFALGSIFEWFYGPERPDPDPEDPAGSGT